MCWKGKGKGGQGQRVMTESGSAGDDALQVQVLRQEEARAAPIAALLQSKMGGR